MACRITSTNRRRAKGIRRSSAFTLVEMMMATAIGGIVMAASLALAVYTTRSLTALMNYVDLDESSRQALDIMSREIRQAASLAFYETNKIVINESGGGQVTYEWNPNTGVMFREENGNVRPLLEECDWLEFQIFQRNPIGGTYDQYPTATPATCKLVQVSWTCSREIMDAKVNTQSVQSAKIVIRSQ